MPTLSNDGYIPDESGVLGKKLIFVLQSIDSYFGSNVFKVEIKSTLKDFSGETLGLLSHYRYGQFEFCIKAN